ncbi:hypothetical protein J6590_100686 [Homalodisca vitripennis]|nr:hypothetical protein J6590_100686 [Homalodisca vitripennis]
MFGLQDIGDTVFIKQQDFKWEPVVWISQASIIKHSDTHRIEPKGDDSFIYCRDHSVSARFLS